MFSQHSTPNGCSEYNFVFVFVLCCFLNFRINVCAQRLCYTCVFRLLSFGGYSHAYGCTARLCLMMTKTNIGVFKRYEIVWNRMCDTFGNTVLGNSPVKYLMQSLAGNKEVNIAFFSSGSNFNAVCVPTQNPEIKQKAQNESFSLCLACISKDNGPIRCLFFATMSGIVCILE